MTKTIIVRAIGGPEAMELVELDPGQPGPGELRIRHTAIGVNFADAHYRRGTAPAHAMAKLPLPFTPGLEATGVVEAIGSGVSGFTIGERVGYATPTLTVGAYTEARLFPADHVYKLPSTIQDVDAAALMYRGIAVHGMIQSCYKVQAGDVVLLHAAAGGVGAILARWASHFGAAVIGTVSSEAKVERALSFGCTHVIVTAKEDFVDRVMALTDGRGVDVVYDGVGRDTFLKSFNAARKYGTVVSFGHSSGMIEPFDPVLLQHNGLYLTRFSGSTYNADTGEYLARADAVMKAMADGVLTSGDPATFRLADVAAAHRDLEARRTVGSIVLIP